MSSHARTIEHLLEACGPQAAARKMFGEYALYWNGKVVALVCNDQLFVKPTEAARPTLRTAPDMAAPYPGAKPHWRICAEHWDDADWLRTLLRDTAAALPAPRPKAPRKPRL